MPFTNYGQVQLLGQIDPAMTFSPPTTWYMALYVSNADPRGPMDELTVDGYAREPLTLFLAGPGYLLNAADITWIGLGATNIGGYALWDDPTGGNQWFFWNDSPVSYGSGTNIRIPTNGLFLTV